MKRQKPSIHTMLLVSIITIIAVPLLVSYGYFLRDSYQSSMERAQFSVQKELDREAYEMRSALFQLQYQIASFARNKAIGELAVNILFAQFAQKQMQRLVEDNAFVHSAFISDGSEFIIEGYPSSTYRIDASGIAAVSKNIMARGEDMELPLLLTLSSTIMPDTENTEPKTLLFFVMPLRKETGSIVNPYRVTSALFVEIDLLAAQTLLDAPDIASVLRFGNALLTEYGTLPAGKRVNVEQTIFGSELDFNQNDSLILSIALSQESFLQRFQENLFYTLVFSALIISLSFFLVLRLSNRVKDPLVELTKTANKFDSGDYQPYLKDQEFVEFEQAINAMNRMAATISRQISSLKEAKLTAEKSEQIKTQFLANMSHEIRTPMNGVLGLLDILNNKVTEREQKQLVARITESAKTLLTIVNDILDLSKLEAGKLQIEHIHFNVKQVLLGVVRTFSHSAKSKNIKLVLDSKAISQDWWQGDPTRITQVLNNLVSNGLKFTHDGQITITVSSLNNSNTDYLEFRIQDTGIGLSQEQQQRLFNKFEQADNSTTRKYGGTGLGLSICKSLVEMMQGQITATSMPGKGSEFCFTVKVEPGEPQQAVPDTLSVPDLSQFRVLVAEDNPINQDILRYLLSETRIQAEFVDNGAKAVNALSAQLPDVILMDVQMPEMSGPEATKLIRAQGFTMPIIMQTANVMTEEIESYLGAGAQAHIGKPIDKHVLYKTLSEVLAKSR
ncbi:HAMP domain-containing hybrid sensor histidine kinase/response regulator [Planctobacterium marinum]|uniref:histidine kinase n=1 Tax=Planctobacterium marinum TaxID=1631968 RepID=A0AA48KUR1_9ALTE|nr:hypothetical protein MACH26_22310 [Planctobacterium marinum]